MSEVFYRKWRPKRLDEVVGQEPVTRTLRQAVALGRVAHAYLFCGPRGTGKTSTARILAKAVNCLSPQEGEPDNSCDICLSINEGRALDLIEIDAASNRGIDDIRDLSEKVHFTPNQARLKVYIIDEVHMLTEYAFNALLKTLEEPPDHAIFVLATTEVQKVPLTVISRCQRFDFRRIAVGDMVDKLAQLSRDEGVVVDDEALELISRSASGSLRDAENILEQVVVSYGSPVTEEHVRDLLELGNDEAALELVGHIIACDVRGGLRVINEVADQGSDLRQLHRGVMEYLRGVLLIKTDAGIAARFPREVVATLRSQADTASVDRLVQTLKTFAGVQLQRDASSPLPLELAVVESCNQTSPRSDVGRAAVSAIAEDLDSRAAVPERSGRALRVESPRENPPGEPVRRNDRREETRPQPRSIPSTDSGTLEGQWETIVKSLRHTGKRFKLGALLKGAKEREIGDGVITVKFPYLSHVKRVEEELADPLTRKAVQEVLAQMMNGPYEIRASLLGGENGPRGSGAARRSPLVRAAQAMGARVVDEKEEET